MEPKIETYNIVTSFLQQSFKPVRLIFPKQSLYYENAIFSCMNMQHNVVQMKFTLGKIKIPCVTMARLLIEYDDYIFELHEQNGNYILDTMGRIPTRFCHMIKDFYFKDQDSVTIDYNSDKSLLDNNKFWFDTINECPYTILKNITMAGFKAAEFQQYKIKVFQGPPYSKNREWFTKDHHHSEAAKEAWKRSTRLYSLGNPNPSPSSDPKNTKEQCEYNQYRYYELGAAEGGIKMRYANSLPWQPVRSHVRYGPFKFDRYVSSCGYTDTRGYDTYNQRKDLSVEEIVVLYEYLKSEGAEITEINE